MKSITFLILFFILINWSSCSTTKVDNLNSQISKLETRLAQKDSELQQIQKKERSIFLTFSSSVSLHIFDDPLNNFFNAPEFWENVYEVAPDGPVGPPLTTCEQRCKNDFGNFSTKCREIDDPIERRKCLNEAFENSLECYESCNN